MTDYRLVFTFSFKSPDNISARLKVQELLKEHKIREDIIVKLQQMIPGKAPNGIDISQLLNKEKCND